MEVSPGQDITMSIRSEKLGLAARRPKGKQSLPAAFVEEVYLGLTTHFLVRLADGSQVMARHISANSRAAYQPGAPVHLVWDGAVALAALAVVAGVVVGFLLLLEQCHARSLAPQGGRPR